VCVGSGYGGNGEVTVSIATGSGAAGADLSGPKHRGRLETPAAKHDEIMGIVQALRHFATFVFGQFLQQRGVAIPRTLELSSPIYRLELAMVGRLFAQDPSLYAEIVFATPERLALLKDYIQSVQQNLELVERGDKAAFIARFHEIAEWFGPSSEQAMRESTFLVEKLVHRF